MTDHKNGFRIGNVVAYNGEPKKYKLPKFVNINVGEERQNGFRAGEIGHPVQEGEDAGSVEDMNDEQVREKALQGFTNNIRQIISAKMMNKPIKIKLTGEDQLVKQIVNLIRKELNYLKALMSGQAADAPAPQKNKAIIDSEAKVLDRMLGVDGAWPFK